MYEISHKTMPMSEIIGGASTFDSSANECHKKGVNFWRCENEGAT